MTSVNKSIKLLSLNTSLFDTNNEKLSQFLKETAFDIVCLQEVTRKVDKCAFDAFISKDAVDKATPKLKNSFYAPNWSLSYFKQHNFHGKEIFECDFGGQIECGNYIKSKFEITEGKSIFLQKSFSYIVDWEAEEKHPGEEPRMVQIVDLKITDTQKVRIINYHGIWSKNKLGTERTLLACQKIAKLAMEVPFPALICGDFNLFPDTESMQVFANNFTNLVDTYNVMCTRPKSNELSASKRNVVDYIFVSKGIEIKSFNVIHSDVSDHFPLVLEFSIIST